jgi:hypothetical protein
MTSLRTLRWWSKSMSSRLAGREAGGAYAGGAAVGLASGNLAFQTGGQEVFVAPGVAPGPPGEAFDAGQQGRGFEFPAQIAKVMRAHHATPVAMS